MKVPCLQHQQAKKLLAKIKLDAYLVAVLLEHVAKGASHPKVGFEHSRYTYDEFIGRLKGHYMEVEDLEAALWSCNLLNEMDEFITLNRVSFQDFSLKCIPNGYRFDSVFNLILEG